MNTRPATASRHITTPPDATGVRPGMRLVVVAVALALALFVTGAVFAWRNYRADRDRITHETALLSQAGAVATDNFLTDRIGLLATVAAAPIVRAGDPAAMRAFFVTLPIASSTFSGGLFWVDSDGLVRASTLLPPGAPPVSAADRDYVRAVLDTGQPFVGAAIRSRVDNRPNVVLAVPTRDDGDRLTGALAGAVTLDQLERTLAGFRIEQTGDPLVVDRAGQLIAGGGPDAIPDVAGAALVRRARAEGTGVIRDTRGLLGASGRLVAFSPAPAGEWLVFVERTTTDGFGPARRTLLAELAALAGIALAGVGGAVWAARRLDALELGQRRAQQQQQESETRFRRIVETANEGIWQVDREARTVFVNERMAEMLGTDAGQMAGRTVMEFCFAEDVPLARERIRSNLQGTPEEFDFRFRRADGSPIQVLAATSPVMSADGAVIGALGMFSDITARVQAEQRARFLSEASTVLAGSLDAEATLREVARLATPVLADYCLIYLGSPGGPIRQVAAVHADPAREPLLARLGADYAPDPANPNSPTARALRTGRPALFAEITPAALATLTDDPDQLAVLARLGPRSSIVAPLVARGDMLGAIVLVMAESGRRYAAADLALAEELARRAAVAADNALLYREAQAAEEQSRRHAARLQALAEASRAFAAASLDAGAVLETVAERTGTLIGDTCIIRLVSDDGQFLEPGAAYDPDPEALAYTREILAATRHRTDEGCNGRVMQSRRSLLIPEIAPQEFRAATKPEYGAYVDRYPPYSILIAPLRVQGAIIGTVSLTRLSPGRPYTPDDEVFLQDLADRAALAVQNARLYEAERAARAEAEAANRAKDEFLSTLSHELRTPLTALLGWVGMLRTRRLDEAATARALDTIDRSARIQAQLVEDILDLSRIITGNLRLRLGPVDLTTVVEAAIESVRPAAEAKDITLAAALDPAVGPASGDPARLQQVVWNLLSNAIKFTPAGGRVEVRLAREGRAAGLTVRDTGAGIDPAFLPHVFERFRQADASSTRAHGGLGLGLAIVRHLVELHGGAVHAHSPGPGHGATFTVHLPLLGKPPAEPGMREERLLSSPTDGAS